MVLRGRGRSAVLLFTPAAPAAPVTRMQLVLVVIDVTAIFIYKIASVDGAYVLFAGAGRFTDMVVLDVLAAGRRWFWR